MSQFILKNEKFFIAEERLFQFSDFDTFLFSEKFRAIRNNFPFYQETVSLILLKFRIFNQPVPELLIGNGHELKRQMERLLVKSKLFKSAVVTVHFFMNKEDVDYILSVEAMDITEFELNKKGLLVDVFDKMPKAVSGLSNLSFGSESLWKVAQTHLRGSGFDDFLIINSNEKIIEGISKKLFLMKGSQLAGVSVTAGAFMDVAGDIIPVIAEKAGLSYAENDGFSEDELFDADELFLLDSINGIHWILGFREKRYYSIKTRQMNDELNKLIAQKK